MARTAVVNPKRRKRRRKSNPSRRAAPRRRRRNYGAAAEVNPRRRRRGKRRSTAIRRRRRNPDSLGRSRNPSFDIDHLVDTIPAATGGVWAARWATKLAGPMEAGQPGLKHAIAIWIAAHFGGQMIGQLFGSTAKGEFARIGALAFGGDLFLRLRFMKESAWMQQNLTLQGVDDVPDYSEGSDLNGFQDGTQLGDSFVDAMGNQYVQTAQGWALAGMGDAQIVQGADGTLYQLGDGSGGEFVYPSNYDSIMEVSGFESGSSIGFHPASGSHASSFGYAP
jgi:hypothetical protein